MSSGRCLSSRSWPFSNISPDTIRKCSMFVSTIGDQSRRLTFVIRGPFSCSLKYKRYIYCFFSFQRWPAVHQLIRQTRTRKWTKRRCPLRVSTPIWSTNTKNERTGRDPLRQRVIPLFLHRYRRLEETMNAENLSEQARGQNQWKSSFDQHRVSSRSEDGKTTLACRERNRISPIETRKDERRWLPTAESDRTRSLWRSKWNFACWIISRRCSFRFVSFKNVILDTSMPWRSCEKKTC